MRHSIIICWMLFAAQLAFSQAASTQPSSGSAGLISGKVIETMDAGDYTYLQVDAGSKKIWAAAPRFKVKKGDTASIASGMPMEKYHSQILNRDFDVVYFTDRVVVNGSSQAGDQPIPELPKDHPPIPGLTAPPAPPKIELTGIKKAEGGNTIAEVYASKTKLKDQQVKVRGKVVKYNPNIMGKNWIHLRDGTGAEGSNDLLVTTTSEVKLGDTVLAAGVVALNKDFGANYKYSLMLEDAKVTVE